jgi:hypothetical protein
MRIKTAKIFVAFMTVAGLLFAAAVLVFLLLPTFREVRALSAEIIRAHTELEAQYANRKHLLESIEATRAARETVRKLASQFVAPGKELDFITAVEGIASVRGVEERLRLTLEGGGGAEELKTSFELSLNGPYHDVMAALVDIERQPALMVVDNVTVYAGGPNALTAPVSMLIRGAIAAPPRNL